MDSAPDRTDHEPFDDAQLATEELRIRRRLLVHKIVFMAMGVIAAGCAAESLVTDHWVAIYLCAAIGSPAMVAYLWIGSMVSPVHTAMGMRAPLRELTVDEWDDLLTLSGLLPEVMNVLQRWVDSGRPLRRRDYDALLAFSSGLVRRRTTHAQPFPPNRLVA